jgi:hypothetical protein
MLSHKIAEIAHKATMAQRLKQDAIQLNQRITSMKQTSTRSKLLIDAYTVKINSIERTPNVQIAETATQTSLDAKDISIFWTLVHLQYDIIKHNQIQKEIEEGLSTAHADLCYIRHISDTNLAELAHDLELFSPIIESLGLADAIKEYSDCLTSCVVPLGDLSCAEQDPIW